MFVIAYIILFIITYFLLKRVYVDDNAWTVGNRLFCVFLGLVWWYTLCIYIVMITSESKFFEKPFFTRKIKP